METHDHAALEKEWATSERWRGIRRDYTADDVLKLRGSVEIKYTLAERGAKRLWDLLHSEPYVPALGAMTGCQAVQQVQAGLKAIYLSGWQVPVYPRLPNVVREKPLLRRPRRRKPHLLVECGSFARDSLQLAIRERTKMKQKSRKKRRIHTIDRAPNDAGIIGNRIADLMLHPVDVAADDVQALRPAAAKRTKRRAEEKTRATKQKRPRR